MHDIDLVVSYYKEDLDWFDQYKHIPFRRIFIYNKGPRSPTLSVPFTEIRLPNIGRCDHTYIYHIIHNYTTLADVTVFATASASLPNKKGQFEFVVAKTLETNTSVFNGPFVKDVYRDTYDFTLDTWDSTHPKNKDGKEAETLEKSRIRPFGKWYDHHFSGISIDIINYLGIFSVSRDHIHNRSMSFYKELIKDFPNHPNAEVGHYLERAWPAVFHPVPKECLYYTNKTIEGFEGNSIVNTPLLLIVLLICSALLALLLSPKHRNYYIAKIAVYLGLILALLTLHLIRKA